MVKLSHWICRYTVWNRSELPPFELRRQIRWVRNVNVIDWFLVWLSEHTRIVIECKYKLKVFGFSNKQAILGFAYLLHI
jgi:hypothetical protein